ncbi:MAG TPA: T9SS type A sorting domain-containing protein, partial [Chitinophagaceae bacterium]|nr:T9SS type A sorting domain-containing protein [Chitinophagaceae bacterium]
EQNEIQVYPNPAHSQVMVQLPALPVQKRLVQLYTAAGQQVYAKEITTTRNETLKIPVQNLAPGVYWLHISSRNNKLIVKKLLIGR